MLLYGVKDVVLTCSCPLVSTVPPDAGVCAVSTVVSCELSAVSQLLWAGPSNGREGFSTPHTHSSATLLVGPPTAPLPFAMTR